MHCVDPNAKYEWGKRKCGSGFLDESLDMTGKTYEKKWINLTFAVQEPLRG